MTQDGGAGMTEAALVLRAFSNRVKVVKSARVGREGHNTCYITHDELRPVFVAMETPALAYLALRFGQPRLNYPR